MKLWINFDRFCVVDIVDIVDIVDFGWFFENLWKSIYFSLFKVYYSSDNWRERERFYSNTRNFNNNNINKRNEGCDNEIFW